MAPRFYIYCFIDGAEVVYVGKGTGSRLKQQEKRFGFHGKIIERLHSEEEAYRREVYWISELRPTENKNAGGSGGLADPNPIPSALRGIVSLKEWDRSLSQLQKEYALIEEMGTRKFAAQILLRKLDDSNCELHGVSKVGLNRIREVANGPRC